MSVSSSVPARLALLYACAVLQGLTVVSFPASSATLKAVHQFSDAQYGALFVPQVVATILGSLAGGALARRIGLATLLRGAAAAALLAEACLASTACVGSGSAFLLVLTGSALMGLGFGLAAAPLNALPALILSARSDAALLGVHTAIGVGFCGGPLLASAFIASESWSGFPIAIALHALACLALGLAVSLPEPGPDPDAAAVSPSTEHVVRSRALWAFLAVAVLYAFAEGTLSNWAVIYLHEEQGLPESSATLALAAFWATLVIGRLLAALLVNVVAPERLWRGLLVLLMLAFVAVPRASTPAQALVVFAFAGLSCSAFFPLSVTLLSRRFPGHAAFTGSLMVASLMLGVGIASFSIGPLHDRWSLATIYLGSALYPAIAWAVAFVLVRPNRRIACEPPVVQTDTP